MENGQLRGWPQQRSSVTDKITEETSAACCLWEQDIVFSKNIHRYVKPSTPLNSFLYLLFCLPCQLQRRCLRVPSMHFHTTSNWYNSSWRYTNCSVTMSFLNWALKQQWERFTINTRIWNYLGAITAWTCGALLLLHSNHAP